MPHLRIIFLRSVLGVQSLPTLLPTTGVVGLRISLSGYHYTKYITPRDCVGRIVFRALISCRGPLLLFMVKSCAGVGAGSILLTCLACPLLGCAYKSKKTQW